VSAVEVLDPALVTAQINACLADIGVDAVKIGMLGSAALAQAVADWLETTELPVVFDPVMIATSGATLADPATIATFERLMARATLTTPNLPELEVLGGLALARQRTRNLLVKGGHGAGATITDTLYTPGGERHFTGTRIATRHTHGTGCTLSSAIATGLAQGLTLEDAVERARQFVRAALLAAPGFGGDHGPLGHHAVDQSSL
jgi:hydroxymethylpyrimidine/phosphomethylpyrimidine kinase